MFAAHGTGGIVGALLTGVFAQEAWNAPAAGLIDGSVRLLTVQAAAVAAVFVYSAVVTFILLKLISLVTPVRRTEREEGISMDVVQHGEGAYNRGEGAVLLRERRTAGSEE